MRNSDFIRLPPRFSVANLRDINMPMHFHLNGGKMNANRERFHEIETRSIFEKFLCEGCFRHVFMTCIVLYMQIDVIWQQIASGYPRFAVVSTTSAKLNDF